MRAPDRAAEFRAVLERPGYEKAAALVIALLFAVGTAGHLWSPTLPLMLAMTPWFLLLCGAAVIAPAVRAEGARLAVWALAAWAATFGLEALGVATGLVFGAYVYGPSLGPMALEVPLVIAFNWVLVTHGAFVLARRVSRNAVAATVLTGLFAAAFDWVMEPAAIRLGYWTWDGADIPLRNYLAWFLIAAAAALFRSMFVKTPAAERGKRPGEYLALAWLAVQAVFFALLRLGWALSPV